MKFDNATQVEQVCYTLKLGDYPRGINRARINDLFNGAPPYTDSEKDVNDIKINVNDLEGVRAAHNGRAQLYSALLKPGKFFALTTDSGPRHQRQKYNTVVSGAINKVMKRSMLYYEHMRSRIALDVLHGIGPGNWENRDLWCPDPLEIADVGIPANTLLHMKNLPYFYVYRSYTAPQLIKLTSGTKNPGWNMDLVKECLEWVDQEATRLLGSNWPEVWAPEKRHERVKGSGAFYASDDVPTIDVYDFYFWSDEGKRAGWRRRMLLDAWAPPMNNAGATAMARRAGDLFSKNNDFLFNSKDRVYAEKISEIISFQFADLSAVAPFRYHSVRSLGFLLYAVCHLQNRLRCKFNESVFEQLMQYFRVAGDEDVQRALKVELRDRGFIPASVQMIPAQERWQVRADLAKLAMDENRGLIQDSSSSYSYQQNFSQDRVEKTKFQVMAEVQGMTAMLSAGLLQAYAYQRFEYQEILRRFMRANSQDSEVCEFRLECLKKGVPEELLCQECWDLEPERVMGAGNKTLEMAVAEQLLNMRPLFDPDPQRQILRDVVMAMTDDPGRAESLVPDGPKPISQSAHDAQLAIGTLMLGLPVTPVQGQNHSEVVEVWLTEGGKIVARINQTGGVPTAQELAGLQNLFVHTQQQIEMIAQNPEEKQRVKIYSDRLSDLANEVRAFQQRLVEQMQQQAQSNGGIDPEVLSKVQANKIMADAKAANTRESHAQRTAQREIAFNLEQKRKQQAHELDMQEQMRQAQVDTTIKDLEAAAGIHRTEKEAQAQASARQATADSSAQE